MTAESFIRPRERSAVLDSLRAGVVPRAGLHHIQVGRVAEVSALLKDIERVADGGSALRFIVGEYGSGKTFFLLLIRSVALEKKLVTIHADLTPDRRLQSTGGQARSLYAELVRNMATRAKPDGGALPNVVEKFVSSAQTEAQEKGKPTDRVIRERLNALTELTGGYDFATVIGAYWRGYKEDDETLKNNALRWLRGEFTSKADARSALDVRTIIDDASVYDHLKLLARFVRLAGYAGLLVCLDEMVNLYKLAHTQSRNANYEQILRILNDSLQGNSVGLGFLLGGTPEFITDPRRGLYSYAALASRLAVNAFAINGLKDYSGPVLSLANLTHEDLYVLLRNLHHVYAGGDEAAYLLPPEALRAFMEHSAQRVGHAYFRTPRTIITAFINFLAILEQNPHVAWSDLIAKVEFPSEINPDLLIPLDIQPTTSVTSGTPAENAEDDLATFRL